MSLRSFCVSLFVMASLFQSKATANNPHRGEYNFNSDWKVFVGDPEGAAHPSFNDQQWEVVTLPHAWNEDEAFKLDIKDLSTGIAWYRKTFVLPEGSDDKNVFVEFEGLRLFISTQKGTSISFQKYTILT